MSLEKNLANMEKDIFKLERKDKVSKVILDLKYDAYNYLLECHNKYRDDVYVPKYKLRRNNGN